MTTEPLAKDAIADYERPANVDYNNVTYQRCQFAYDHFAIPYITGKKVLDVGCGHGYGTAEMAKHAADMTGADYSQQPLKPTTPATPKPFQICASFKTKCRRLISLTKVSMWLQVSNSLSI